MSKDFGDRTMWRRLLEHFGVAVWLLFLFAGLAMAGDDESPRGPISIVGTVVDEAGNLATGITVQLEAGLERPTAVTNADGAFRFSWSRPGEISGLLIASNRGGTRKGTWRLERWMHKPCRIVLKPKREVVIHVTDASGAAVDAARVIVLEERILLLTTGVTDTQGQLAVHLPVDAVVGQIAALKPGMGCDYFTTLAAKQSPERKPLPDEVRLKLSGAHVVRIKAIDGAGVPVAGVTLFPWYFSRKGKAEDLNLSGCTDAVGVLTNDEGVAVFDWLPREFVQGIPFMCRSLQYHALDMPSLKEEGTGNELTLSLLRKTTLSGRVTFPDGRPAAGIAIYADGAGKAAHSGHESQFTSADGSYEMSVNSEEGYIVSVRDERWAAPFRAGVVIREGKSVSGIDFALSDGTVLHGRVLSATDSSPVPDSNVGLTLNVIRSPAEESEDKGRMFGAVHQYQAALSDHEGRYRFCVGPGTYDLGGTQLVVKNQQEIVQDVVLPRSATLLALRGKVVDGEGRPVAAASISGVYKSLSGRDIETDTLVDGTFRVQRLAMPSVIFAKSADGKEAGLTPLDAEQTDVILEIGPVASARGRLLNELGQPLPGAKVSWGVKVYMGDTKRVPFRWCFGGSTKTDDDGKYEMSGLMPAATYEVTYYHESDSRYSTLNVFTPQHLSVVELGDTPVQPKPKPYQPPTIEEKTADFFKNRGPLAQRVSIAQDEARRCYLRVLLILGEPTSPASRKLIEVRDNDWSRGTMDQFEQVGVSTADAEAMATLRQQYGDEVANLPAPAMVVIDENNMVVGSKAMPLEGADATDIVTAGQLFLEASSLPRLDAEKLLADALERARRENKCVFLQETATWCGPCRLLARFVDRHKSLFDQHFVSIKVDRHRFARGEEVMSRLRRKNGGIPWVLVLDDQANPLGCSEDDDGENYGFPVKAEEIKRFLELMAKAAPGLTSKQLDVLRTDLESKP